jgi:uncharacterized protein (DUF885 family)
LERLQSGVLGGGEPQDSLEYSDVLRHIYGVEINELLKWYKEEVERCETALIQKAKEIDANRTPLQILEEDLPAADSPEAMFELLRRSVSLAREKCQEYVTLPPGEDCGVKPVAEHIKDYYPWGGYSYHGNLLRGDLTGHVFLNQYNYRTISRGWIYLNAVHECYPGHHTQAVKTAAANMPNAFKMASAVPLSEGICMRSETLMQDIFGDPVYPLFVLYRRLHTSVRIWADLVLHHFKEGEERAKELYVRYLGLADHVAAGQVKSQIVTPGYFTTYYYGLKYLDALQEECGWNNRDFTELIFSCGKLYLHNVRRLVFMPEEDRILLCQQFYPNN